MQIKMVEWEPLQVLNRKRRYFMQHLLLLELQLTLQLKLELVLCKIQMLQ
jgi:hypothetical protein